VNLDDIVAELENERDRLVRAIEALAGAVLPAVIPRKAGRAKAKVSRRRMSPAARRRISIAMKKRWAERRNRGWQAGETRAYHRIFFDPEAPLSVNSARRRLGHR
jgi:hypothetical protein